MACSGYPDEMKGLENKFKFLIKKLAKLGIM